MTQPLPITLVGATGLTGSATLLQLLSSTQPFDITSLTRKSLPIPEPPKNSSTKYTNIHLDDLKEAYSSSSCAKLGTQGGIYVSCLGTTRAVAGGVEKQREIDLDLNRDLARKAKEDGVDTMILVSSGGANPNSFAAYPKMKGELEEAVKEMDFKHCFILRPGLLMGDRTESRPAEWATRKLFGGLKFVGLPMNRLMTDDSDVGACIAYLALNPPSEKTLIIDNAQIIELAGKFKKSVQDSQVKA